MILGLEANIMETPNAILQRINNLSPAKGVDNDKFKLATEIIETEAVTEDEAEGALKNAKNIILDNIDKTAKYAAQSEQNIKDVNNITNIVSGSIQEIAKATNTINTMVQTADLKAQNQSIALFDLAGGEEVQSALAARLKEDEAKLEVLANERTEIANTEYTGIRLIDNVINEFNISMMDTKVRAAEAERDQTINQIANFTGATDAFTRQNNLVRKTSNAATIEANTAKVNETANREAAEARLTSIATNARTYESLLNASGRELEANMSLYRLQGEAETRDVQRERFALTRQQIAAELEDLPARREAAKVELEAAKLRLDNLKTMSPMQIESARMAIERDTLTLQSEKELTPLRITQLKQNIANNEAMMPVNVAKSQLAYEEALKNVDKQNRITAEFGTSIQEGMAIAGVPIEKDLDVIMAGLSAGGQLGKRYEELLLIGKSGTGQIATNPYDTARTIDIIAPNGLNVENDATRLLEQIDGALDTEYKAKLMDAPRDEETKRADFNRVAKELQLRFASNIETGDNSNPYQAPNMEVLAKAKAVRESALYQKVLKTSAKQEFDPEFIFTQAVRAVRDKTITADEAANGIYTIGEVAIGMNNSLNDFTKFGLEPQTSYNVKVKMGTSVKKSVFKTIGSPVSTFLAPETGFVRESQTVDLGKLVDVRHAVVKRLSVQLSGTDLSVNKDTNKIEGQE